MKRLFTSESVTEGHPDKLCDYISDSILDSYLAKDKNARVACETVAGKGEIFITGEITSTANVDIEQVVRDTIKEVGYADSEYDIDYRTCKIYINLSKQSPDIALGVDKSLEDKEGKDVESEGAGDQGLMFGYACDETESLMPYAIDIAHKLAYRLAEVRKQGIIQYLKSDGKVQVTAEYLNNFPFIIDTILISTQHDANADMDELENDIIEKVIKPVVESDMIDVDTYGGYAHHGGGAFSGKDGTKVDRSASYMLRHIAKCVVANGLARRCEIQISYGIGMKNPISFYIDCFGTNRIPEIDIINIIKDSFDLTPEGIIEYLKLKEPIYSKTTNYGHFGRDGFTWEEVKQI